MSKRLLNSREKKGLFFFFFGLHPAGVAKIQLKALSFSMEDAIYCIRQTEKSHIISSFISGGFQISIGHSVLEKPALETQTFCLLGLLAITPLEGTKKSYAFGTDTPSPGISSNYCTSGVGC